MAYTVWDPAPLWTAILTRLRTSTGKNIGEGEAPSNNTLPYAVFYPQEDEDSEGSLNDPLQAVTFAFQVTCVGSGLFQAGWMQTKVRAALLGWTPTVTGVGTTPVDLLRGSGFPRDDALSGNPTFFYSHDLFSELASI